MKRLAIALLFSLALSAQELASVSTKCQASGEGVPVPFDLGASTDRRLIGCGEGFPDNLLWHLDRSDSLSGALDESVTFRATGRGAVVYVLDSGIRADHEEFRRPTGTNVVAGYDAGGWDGFTMKNCVAPVLAPCPGVGPLHVGVSHGTAVASLVAGTRSGVAPDASLVAVRVTLQEANWVVALRKVIEHAYAPATPQFRTGIVNISGGISPGDDPSKFPDFEPLMRRMITGVGANGEADADGKRFLFVVAAGNSGAPFSKHPRADRGQCDFMNFVKMYPAVRGPEIDGLITVGGLGQNNAIWTDSCRGPAVEVLAPAENMLVASLTGDDTYRWKPAVWISGTSYATPYVSGMAARLLELDPSLTPAELESRLARSPSRVEGLPVPVWPAAQRRRAVR